jgi:hypothetical protein
MVVRKQSKSLRASNQDPLEVRQVRNVARQRAKVVVEEQQYLRVLQAEQLRRHLCQSHAHQLKTIYDV